MVGVHLYVLRIDLLGLFFFLFFIQACYGECKDGCDSSELVQIYK